MIKTFQADLHIHSCLSPCADLDMTPAKIIQRASEADLNIIAVSDHNSAENAAVTQSIAREFNISVLPAMEITTSEEVHIIALFDTIEDVLKVQKRVHEGISKMPVYRHDETSQPIVNEREEVLSFNPLPLINATDIPLAVLVDLIHDNGGLAVASHIDREAFGIISQLGFIPPGLPLDAVEVSFRVTSEKELTELLTGQSYPVLSFSDAHHPDDIGRRVTELHLEQPSFNEIAKCLREEGGRKARIVY